MRSSSCQSFSQIRPLLLELLPQKPQNWAQFCPALKKVIWKVKIWKVKSRMGNTQKLKLVDPQTADVCQCYKLCENLGWPFGRAPRVNLVQIFQTAWKRTNKYQCLASFCNNQCFQMIFFQMIQHKILHLKMELVFVC